MTAIVVVKANKFPVEIVMTEQSDRESILRSIELVPPNSERTIPVRTPWSVAFRELDLPHDKPGDGGVDG